jgi:hypothetical protein
VSTNLASKEPRRANGKKPLRPDGRTRAHHL